MGEGGNIIELKMALRVVLHFAWGRLGHLCHRKAMCKINFPLIVKCKLLSIDQFVDLFRVSEAYISPLQIFVFLHQLLRGQMPTECTLNKTLGKHRFRRSNTHPYSTYYAFIYDTYFKYK